MANVSAATVDEGKIDSIQLNLEAISAHDEHETVHVVEETLLDLFDQAIASDK
jgi:hypothetical protein